MFIFVVSFFLIFLTFYFYLTWNFDYWQKRGVAGPKPRAYVGTFPKTATLDKSSNYIKETTEIYRGYYRKHRFIGVFQYRQPKLMILDPSLVVDIYVKYFKHFGDNTISDILSEKTDPLHKPNPFVDKLAEWKGRRLELVPIFTTLKIKGIFPAIENACRNMEQYVDKKIELGQNILVSKDISSRVIADMVCNIVFGLDARAFDEESEFLEQAHNILYSVPFETIRSAAYEIFPWIRKIYPQRLTPSEFTIWFKALFDQAVHLRKENNIYRDDYLNFLIELREKKNITMDIIYAHAFTYFLNGFETTSYILGSALNNLAENTECQEKLRSEIKSFGHITFETLQQMPYLDAVINETTRKSPSPFPIWKNCTEDIMLSDFDGSTLFVEKGVQIILPIAALHSHPDFYEHPEKFDPERFDESIGGVKRFKDAGVFLPFGNGPRQCLGMRYAVTKIKAALCSFVRNFEFSLQHTDDKPSQPTGLFAYTDNSASLRVHRL